MNDYEILLEMLIKENIEYSYSVATKQLTANGITVTFNNDYKIISTERV